METKTGYSAAPVPVLPFLNRVLTEHRKRSISDGYIFGSNGRPIDIHKLGARIVRPALREAGIPWMGWHAFRRGLATNLHRIGVQPRTIQAILRHSNVSTTLAFCGKTSPVDAHAAMARLEAEMGNEWATIRRNIVS